MMKKATMWPLLFVLVGLTPGKSGTISREYHKTHEFDGDQVSVKTVNGKVFVETWRQDAVDVFADIKVRASNKSVARDFMDEIEIVIRQRGEKLDIRVERPDGRNSSFWDWVSGTKPNVTVDFSIKVPEEMDVDAASVNGTIEVVDIEGHVSLSTTNGRISAENIVGPVEASTINGSIYVEIYTDDLDDDVSLHTVNGSIKLVLDQDVEADVDISTVNGSINTDFPLEVKGKWGPKNVRGEINGGGALVELETVNGSVSILER